MKITEAEYATREKAKELFDLFEFHVKMNLHRFSIIVIQINGINHVIKDIWKDTYKDDEWNVKYLLDKDFRIIDKGLLTRSLHLLETSSLFDIGENIIIVCD